MAVLVSASGAKSRLAAAMLAWTELAVDPVEHSDAPASIVLMKDAFTTMNIDPSKWALTNPNSRITQNGTLNIANPHTDTRALFVDQLKSVVSVSSGVVVVQANLTWTTDGDFEAQGGLFLYVDANNYCVLTSDDDTTYTDANPVIFNNLHMASENAATRYPV